jgi:hypothetical protein
MHRFLHTTSNQSTLRTPTTVLVLVLVEVLVERERPGARFSPWILLC